MSQPQTSFSNPILNKIYFNLPLYVFKTIKDYLLNTFNSVFFTRSPFHIDNFILTFPLCETQAEPGRNKTLQVFEVLGVRGGGGTVEVW